MHKNFFFISILLFLTFTADAQQYSFYELIGGNDENLKGKYHKVLGEVQLAYDKMQKAARKDGIDIQIVSAYRSYDRQKSIWNRKYKRFIAQGMTPNEAVNKIIEYSTIPGTSRHHWGTDIDIIDGSKRLTKNVLDPKKFGEGKPYYKLKKWLDKNANKYGFYLVYTDDPSRKGFKYEPWHFSYKPLSQYFLDEYMQLDIVRILKESEIEGAGELTNDFLKKYIKENLNDINPELK